MTISDKIKLNFDDDFFYDEIRCDYKVSSKQKRIWAIEIDLLNELINVCKKYDIKLFVFAGTLLGAARHNGFIPWDDDVDVCLTRTEYEKLLKVAPKEFKSPYFFQTALSDRRYFVGFSRLRNSLTTGHIKGQKSIDYNQGIYIDIFVLDGYVDDKFLLKKQLRRRSLAVLFLSSYTNEYIGNTKFAIILKKIVGNILHYTVCKIIPYETAVKYYDGVLKMYNGKCENVTFLTHPISLLQKYYCKITDLDTTAYLPFENITVPVPASYKQILKNIYGDYMKYPPLSERGKWHEGSLELDPDIPYKEYLKNKNRYDI